MANDDPYNWLQNNWASSQPQEGNSQGLDAHRNTAYQEHPAFADAERIVRASHDAFLRSQQQMRSTQNGRQNQQHGFSRFMSQSPRNYQSPYFQGQQQSHERRGSQGHHTQQAPQALEPHQWQQHTNYNQHQQFGGPSDISSPQSSYQSTATREAYGQAATAGPSQSSVAAEMTASRPTMTPGRAASTSTESQFHMALLGYLQRSIASLPDQGTEIRSPSTQQAARVATSSPRLTAPTPKHQTAHQTRPESCSQTPAQASSLILDSRNANINAARYGAPSPINIPSAGTSHSAVAPHTHISKSPAATAQPLPPRDPTLSTSQSPRLTTAGPAISRPPTTHVSSTPSASAFIQTSQAEASIRQSRPASSTSPNPYNPPRPSQFVPHSGLHAPPQTGQARSGWPRKHVVYQPPPTSSPSLTPSGAQITPDGWARASAGPPSYGVPASRPLISYQPRAADMAAQASSLAQSRLSLSTRVGDGTTSRGTHPGQGTRSPNRPLSSGLPLPPTVGRPAPTPVNHQQRPTGPNAPKPAEQPVQQASIHGYGQGQPPSKIRRMQDGTGHPVAPSTAMHQKKYSNPYAVQSPGSASILKEPNIVQPLDHREAALKETYDPATIARDVLINANKHPTEKPLNHHLEILRTKFAAVDFTSDLSTFRWDLVDSETRPRDSTLHRPGPPTTRPQARPVYQHHYYQSQHPTGPSTLGSLPFKPPAYQPRSAPEPPAPAPAPVPARLTPHPTSYPARSATGPRVESVPAPHPPAHRPVPHHPPVIDLASQPAAKAAPVAVPPPASTPAPLSPSTSGLSTAPAPLHSTTPSRTAQVSQSPQPKPGQAQKSPARAPSQSTRTKNYALPQVVISTSPENMPPLKRKQGRPRKTTKKVEVAIHNEPNVAFPVFRCRWTNCQSELHNMRTLQNHVLKRHIPNDINCGWEGCSDKTPMAANKMWAHVREKHVEPMAWTLGDGPSVKAPGEDPKLALDNLSQS